MYAVIFDGKFLKIVSTSTREWAESGNEGPFFSSTEEAKNWIKANDPLMYNKGLIK